MKKSNALSESDKAEIVRKIDTGLAVNEAGEIYAVDLKSIYSWQIQLPGGHVSIAEKIRLLELQVAQLNQRISDLEQAKDSSRC